MKQLPPGAVDPKRNQHGRTWYVQQVKKTLLTSVTMLNDGKLQSAPYLIWAALYAMIIFCRWFFPEYQDDMTIIMGICGVLSIIFAVFSVQHHQKPEVILSAIGIGVAFFWLAAAFRMGIDIRVLTTGAIVATILGIPYWRELARIKNPAHTYLTPAVTEPEKPKGEFDDVKWLQPDAAWANSRTPTQSGWLQRLDLPTGTSAADFIDKRAGGMASVLKVGHDDVELVRVPGRNDMVDVYVHNKGDFLATPTYWPPLEIGKLPNFWDPIPFGVRKSGETIMIDMREKHLMIAGESGSGKSNELSKLAAIAAHDPAAQLWCLDGKRLELLPFRHAAKGYVQDNIVHAVAMLRAVQEEMNFRYDEMGRMGIRKAHDSNGTFGPIVVMFDELARYLREGAQESAHQKEFVSLIFDLGERGRAAGVSLITSVIRPSAKLFNGGDMRALFIYRQAMRMADPQGSRMVLGDGAPDASQIPQEIRGMGYLFEGQIARIMRGFYVPDEHLSHLAETAPVCEDQWGVFMADAAEGELVAGKGEFRSQGAITKFVPKELTEGGATRLELPTPEYDGPTFPDGTPITEEWHVKMWESLSDTEFTAVSRLEAPTGKTRNPIIVVLRRWTEAGYLEPTVDGNTTKWRRKAKVDA